MTGEKYKCEASRYVLLLPLHLGIKLKCELVGFCGRLSLQKGTEVAAALLPVFLDWSGRVVRVVVHNGHVHSPCVAVGAVPPVVCNQRKLQPHALSQGTSPSSDY